ncbi:MAG: hypothetical protein V7L01_01835 [Nostoc sp.]|uniref:hypothetical protein n=1 Tax=Nostoc sp. TaxID=1180 RepID=UPI002FF54042
MIKRGIKFVISFFLICVILLNFPSNALANMDDWRISNAVENNTGNWVYYVYNGANALFASYHMSRNADNRSRDHMATFVNGITYYYFGNTGTFNIPNLPANIAQTLVNAWRDYYNVR